MTESSSSAWQARARAVAFNLRKRVLEFTLKNNGGYLSQACSSAETFATLYTHLMHLGPSTMPPVPPPFPGVPNADNAGYFTGAGYNGPQAPELDRFIMSPVHYGLVLYTVLVEVGRMAPEGLDQFNCDGSTVEMIGAEHSPGHEVTAGSLGQGISQAGGIALARRLKGDRGRVWLYMSDGEFQSGQTWEAIQALVHHRIDNLIIYVDVNAQQCDGAMCDVMTIDPLDRRLEAFGARVAVVDGHDVEALAAPAALVPDGRPLVVLAITNPAQGIPALEARRPKLHYVRFKNAQEKAVLEQALAELQSQE